MFGTYVGNGRVLVATTFGAKLLVSSDDLSLMPDLVTLGGYDEPFTNLTKRTLSAGQVAIDVGANVGLFTMLMAWQVGPTGQVLSYEAEPRNVALLRDNVAMNYASWVDIYPQAAGAKAGKATFFRTSRFHGNSSLMEHGADYAEHFRHLDEIEPIDVDVVALDEQIGRFEQIDLVKIDVEGAELQVLQGMRQLLSAGVVARMSVEVTRDRMEEAAWDALVDELRGLRERGWQFSTVEGDGATTPLPFATLVDRGVFSQVVLDRPSVGS